MSIANFAAEYESHAYGDNCKKRHALRRLSFLHKRAYCADALEFNAIYTDFRNTETMLKTTSLTLGERMELNRISTSFARIASRHTVIKSENTSITTPNTIVLSVATVPAVANHTNATNIRLNREISTHRTDIQQTVRHSQNIRAAQSRMRTETVARGVKYRNNTTASRAGYMIENAMAESVNVDAIIKKSPVRAIVPDCNTAGSSDIIVTNTSGEKTNYSSKVHATATKSAKAQTDPRLDGQRKIIPRDQLAEGVQSLEKRAYREALRGRPNAAAQQRTTADALSDGIFVDGVESIRPTKKNAHDLSKAISADSNGEALVDMGKIDKVMEDTGITTKVDKAVQKNKNHIKKQNIDIANTKKARVRTEIKGAAAAMGIAAITTAATTFATNLIQNGISLETVQAAAINGAQVGAEGGAIALGVYGVTRTAGVTLYNVATNALANTGVNVTANIAAGVGIGVMGAVATTAVSTYTFVKMKTQGATTREALAATGKNAATSLAVTAATGIATLALGATAGIVVSAVIGIGMIGYSLFKAFRSRRKEKAHNGYTFWGNPSYA